MMIIMFQGAFSYYLVNTLMDNFIGHIHQINNYVKFHYAKFAQITNNPLPIAIGSLIPNPSAHDLLTNNQKRPQQVTIPPSMFYNAALPFAVLDNDACFLDFSDQWLKQFQQGTSIRGKSFFEVMPPLPQEFIEDLKTCTEEKPHRSNTARMLLESGDTVWYDWKISCIKTGFPLAHHTFVLLEDITHKRLDEDLLIRSQRVARIGGYKVDLIHNTLYWSAMTKEIHEVPQDFEPDIQKAIYFYKKGYSRDTISSLVQEGIAFGKPWDAELQIITAKGKELWVRAIGEPEIVDGRCVGIIGTFQDIERRKSAQLQVRTMEESLQVTLDNSSVGMALVSINGTFLRANTSLCRSLGYSETELLGMTLQEITHDDDLGTDRQLLEEIINGERVSYQIEKRLLHRSGTVVYVILTVTAARNIQGEISHFITQIVDISLRKSAEKRLQELFDLTAAQNESLLNFAYIVSHNLRSHASNLSMISHFLNDQNLSDEERKETTLMLGMATEGLNETIAHLNEVVQVKLEGNKELKEINLRYIVHKILKDIKAALDESQVEVYVDIPEDTAVLGISAYLESVVLNLLTNAIKYRDKAKGKAEISVRSCQRDSYIVLTVQDNGLGIDLKTHGDKLFGMYKTFHGNEDARGIGLFITKNQIESMGGKISVQSTPGEGTTFEILLKKGKRS